MLKSIDIFIEKILSKEYWIKALADLGILDWETDRRSKPTLEVRPQWKDDPSEKDSPKTKSEIEIFKKDIVRDETPTRIDPIEILNGVSGHYMENDNYFIETQYRNYVAILIPKNSTHTKIDKTGKEVVVKVLYVYCTMEFQQKPYFFQIKEYFKDYKLRIDIAKSSLIINLYKQFDAKEINQYSSDSISQPSELFDTIIRPVLRSKGLSDIHVICKPQWGNSTAGGAILYRVDGDIVTGDSYPPDALIKACAYGFNRRSKAGSQSDTVWAQNKILNSSIEYDLDEHPVRLRFQQLTLGDDSIHFIYRNLPVPPATSVIYQSIDIDKLGYTKNQSDEIRMASLVSTGAIFIAGTVGSGKSTTIKAILENDPDRKGKITYTIEDPIEQTIRMVSQIPIQRSNTTGDKQSIGIGFAEVMNTLLRADPDRIVPGEIRDRATGAAVKTAVLTGHQVMTTVHSSSACGVIMRLASNEIGMSLDVLGAEGFISALIYQKLLPINCEHCSIPSYKVETREYLLLIKNKYNIDVSGMRSINKNGCSFCCPVSENDNISVRGVTGRKVVAEVVIPSTIDGFMQAVRANNIDLASDLWRSQRTAKFNEPNMTGKTAMEHAIYDMAMGLIDCREIEKGFTPFKMAIVHPIKNKG